MKVNTGTYLTEQIRILVVKLLKKITKDIEKTEDECYAWINEIGEALLPITWLSKYLTNNEVDGLCSLLDLVQEEDWSSINERVSDNIDDKYK